jgi:hypothetical protein
MCSQVWMQVVVERVSPARPKIGADAVDGQIHLRQPPGVLVQLLAIDRNVERSATVGLDEPLRLYEHAARAAARVVHPAAWLGLKDLD